MQARLPPTVGCYAMVLHIQEQPMQTCLQQYQPHLELATEVQHFMFQTQKDER
jgi:hypothetical protein